MGFVGTFLAVSVLFHGAVAVGVVVARVQGRQPEPPRPIGIENLRRVDDRVWASSQPDPEHYRELADGGITLIVDLRTGAGDDRDEVDAGELRRVGIDYLRLAVQDGHVPADRIVRRFIDVVEDARGTVLVHCGAGVGRSSTLVAGYRSYQGGDVSLWDTLALGSVTVAQAWFLTTGQRNEVVRRISEALDAPRRGWSRLSAWVGSLL